MTPEHWQQIKDIVNAVLDQEPQHRAQFLAEACNGDTALRREVESLLEHNEESFIEQPAFALAETLPSEPASSKAQSQANRRVGPYKLVRELGHGGMGTVYLAVREDEFRKQVALKIIKRGMDSDFILRRFRTERQILASLEHPNIARLLDGGTAEDGSPYFVMEYVEGQAINDYCDTHRLTTVERLKQFQQVCAAVHYAHQHLIIHRDLKPSNIIVTADGIPKLLDFGIAKLLTPELAAQTFDLTSPEMRLMTPEYASPEQVRGLPMTTASDVYSLGVILYELLTGHRPYRLKSRAPHEIMQAVCESEPEKPSTAVTREEFVQATTGEITSTLTPEQVSRTRDGQPALLRRRLQGDIDNIVLMAMRKEPQRRYVSAEQFSEDIRRHLEGLPVIARKSTLGYRTAKFVRRNKLALGAAALVLLTLIGGIVTTQRARARAERRFNDVRQLARAVVFDYHDAIAQLPGATPVRERLVKDALVYLDSLNREADDDAGLQRELAAAYERIGKIQGNSYFANLGDAPGAMKSYQKSLEIRRRLHQADLTNRELQHELAASYAGVGDMFYSDNDLPNGLRSYDEALAIRLTLVEAEPQNRKYLYELAELHSRRGDIRGMEGYANLGDTRGAIDEYTHAVAIAEKLVAAEPDDEAQWLLAGNLRNLAMLQNTVGKSAEALASVRKAVAVEEALVARNPNNARMKTTLMSSLSVLRYPLIEENLLAEAEETAKRVLAETEKAVATDPQDTNERRNLSVGYNDLARVLRDSGKPREAIAYHERALQIIEKLAAAASSSNEFKSDEILTRSFLAQAQLDAGDYAAALANFERCAAAYEKDLVAAPAVARTKDDLATVYAGIGSALAQRKQFARALEFFDRAVPFAEVAARQSPDNARVQIRLAKTYFESGKHWKQFANDETARRKACELLQKSFDVWDGLRQKGSLSKFNQPRPDEVARELSACR